MGVLCPMVKAYEVCSMQIYRMLILLKDRRRLFNKVKISVVLKNTAFSSD